MKSAAKAKWEAMDESHPTRGAWIEIQALTSLTYTKARRTPHRVRGLKYGMTNSAASAVQVAPHTGCVD